MIYIRHPALTKRGGRVVTDVGAGCDGHVGAQDEARTDVYGEIAWS